MGKRGRKPHPRLSTLTSGAVATLPGKPPEKSSLLDDEARVEWDRIVPELDRLGMLCSIDQAVLESYCITYSRWKKAERAAAKRNDYYETTAMGRMICREVLLALQCQKELRQLIIELGLSPASRGRITVGAPSGKEGSKGKSRFFGAA